MTYEIDSRVERLNDHVFQENEEVYVIDKNGYDIYKGKILSITNDGQTYEIDYPEYETREYEDASKILPITSKNTNVFNEQEKIRKRKEEKSQNFSSDNDSTDESDQDFQSQSVKKKEPKPKKEKPKKEPKPKKEKAEKPKKEPKPKKEKAEKPKHQQKGKGKQNRRQNDYKYIREAYKKGVREGNEFVRYLEGAYPNKEFLLTMLTNEFENYVQMHENQNDGFSSDYDESQDESMDEPEAIPEFPEERLTIGKPKSSLPPVGEIDLPSWIKYNQGDEAPMSINSVPSSDDPNSLLWNAFIYQTDDGKKYLILNGFKLELEPVDLMGPEEYFYERISAENDDENTKMVTKQVFLPAYKKVSEFRIHNKPAEIENMTTKKKNKRKKEEAIYTAEELESKNKAQARKPSGSKRSTKLTKDSLEDSD